MNETERVQIVKRAAIQEKARYMRQVAARADRYEYIKRETDAANAWEAAELAKLDD